MKEYFAILSGENIDLGKAELKALLSLVYDKYSVEWYSQLAIIKGESNPIKFILNRAAMTKEAGLVVLDIPSSSDIFTNLSDDSINSLVQSNESFCIRTRSYTNQKDSQYREQLVVDLGAVIGKRTGARVSMKNPDVTILIVFTTDRIFVCKSMKSEVRRLLRERKPGKKEFFHPSMMNTQLARVMCNLARIMPGETVFDPFCGGGGILCEIASLGAKPIGMDLNWRLLAGAKRNITSMSNHEYNLIQGDAQFCPVSNCDSIVTDPPYGQASSTKGSDPKRLVEALISQSQSLLKNDGIICICTRAEMKVVEILNDMGLKVEFAIYVRVHRSLVREVIAFRV